MTTDYDYVEALRGHGSRLAVIEEQNKQAEKLHDILQTDVTGLKIGQARMETKLDMALGNGKTKVRKAGESVGMLVGSGTVVGGIIVGILKGTQWVS